MALSLPAHPDIEHLRRDARRLQREVRAGDVHAVALVARHHPHGVPDDPASFALAGAQLVVARAHGFPSWPRMLDYLRSARPLWRDPGALDPVSAHPDGVGGPDDRSPGELASATAALACLTYTDRDEPARWARAAAIVARRPDLVHQDLAVAAAAGDSAAVRSHVAGDAGSATR